MAVRLQIHLYPTVGAMSRGEFGVVSHIDGALVKYLAYTLTFGLLAFFIIIAVGGLPAEFGALLCLIAPSAISGGVGYVIGKRGRPRLRLEFPEPQANSPEAEG